VHASSPLSAGTHVTSVSVTRALHFVRTDPRLLAFGLLLTLGSGFGQTWFIALYSGDIRAALAISNGEFGAAFSAGTLASAALLTWSGHWIDRLDLRRWTTIVVILSALACAGMAVAQNVWVLVFVVFLLRHMGQGLMSHTAVISQGRYYEAARGRAVATVALGGPVSRAILPLTIVVTVAAIGWRQSWFVVAAALAVVLLPVSLWLLRGHDQRHRRYLESVGGEAKPDGEPAPPAPGHWTRAAVIRDPRFYALLPIILAPSFIGTGITLHQVVLVEAKGWAIENWAAGFIAHAAASVVSGLALGATIDRVGAHRALPWLLPPLAIACLLLAVSDDPLAVWGYMIFAGLSSGMTMVCFDAFWPYAYGTRHLGAIRALAFTFMVLGSALAPATMGAALDRGVSFEAITLACAIYCAFASVVAVLAARLYRRR
jgi:MFS family permease